LFGSVQDSSLVAQLRNVTRAKYREAVRVLNQTKSALAPKSKVPVPDRRRPMIAMAASAIA